MSIKSPPPKRKRRDGGDHVGTASGGPEVIAQDHVGTADRGPGETVPNPTPDPKSGKSQKSRNLEKQAAPVGHSKRSHFDKSPDVEIPTPEVMQVAGPAVTDNATPPDAEIPSPPDAEILSHEETSWLEKVEALIVEAESMRTALDKIKVLTDRIKKVETEVAENFAIKALGQNRKEWFHRMISKIDRVWKIPSPPDAENPSPPDAEIPSPPDAEVLSTEEVGCPEVVAAVTVEAVPTRVTTILSPPGDRNQEPEIPSLPDAEILSPPDAEIPSPPDAKIPSPPDAGVLSHEEVGWPEVVEAVTVKAESKEIGELTKAIEALGQNQREGFHRLESKIDQVLDTVRVLADRTEKVETEVGPKMNQKSPDAEIPSPPDAEIPSPPDAEILSHEETSWLKEVEAESKEVYDEILSYDEMNDTADFNQSTLSDESKDGWSEELKKINDAMLLYDEKNDTAYFNRSTFSDESEEGWAEETSPGTNQRQQNDADQGQQKGQIGPWDPGIRLAEEPDSDHKSTTPSGTSGLKVQSLTC